MLLPSVVTLLLIAGLAVAVYAYVDGENVDTEAMLDVSGSIRTISTVRTDPLGDSVWDAGSGSGFLVSKDGCEVWTNHHVVQNAALIEVYPRDWQRSSGVPATLVSATPRHDIALLRMQSCETIPAATLGDSERIYSGDETYAVGNPLGRNPDSISRGIVSHTERYVRGATRASVMRSPSISRSASSSSYATEPRAGARRVSASAWTV